MNILLVNNDTDSWEKLVATCSGPANQVTPAHHSQLATYDISTYDLVVLSGGWWYDDYNELVANYSDEIKLIRTSPTPILGICIGMQLMHVALERDVPLLDARQDGYQQITLSTRAQTLFDLPEMVSVFKYHTRAVLEADPEFETLARSPGHIEIMLHRSRPLLGVQFHPESEPTLEQSQTLFKKLVHSIAR